MTTIATIDGQTAVDLLAAAVELAGADHVYKARSGVCYYLNAEGNCPDCIVGVALAIHGVPLDVMAPWDDLSLAGGIESIARNSLAPFIEPDAVEVFAAAQKVQDGAGYNGATPPTWGDALSAARNKLAEFAPDGDCE